PDLRVACRRALVSGSLASLFSAVALALLGTLEGRTAAGPLNGPSQWVFGEHAAHRRQWSARYTLVGYAIHHLASVGWALLHERHVRELIARRGPGPRSWTAAATATVACISDFLIARGRLRPGFEKQLNWKSLSVVYAAFALGLSLQFPARTPYGSRPSIGSSPDDQLSTRRRLSQR